MWIAVTTLCLAAAPVKLGALGLTGSGMPADRMASLSEYVAAQIAVERVEVVTQKEIQSVLGFERQKQLLGCAEASECMAELASGLGVDGLLLGDIALVANTYLVSLKVIRASSSKPIAVQSFEAKSEAELIGKLKQAAIQLARDVRHTLGGEVLAEPSAVSTTGAGPSRRFALVPAALGLAAGIAGTVLIVQSQSMFELLAGGHDVPSADALNARNSGPIFRTSGWIAAGVGIAALAGAAIWWFLGADGTTVSADVTATGSSAMIRVTW